MICLYAGKLDKERININQKIRKENNLAKQQYWGLVCNPKEIDGKKYLWENHKVCDITKDLRNKFADNSIDTFISEHVFEHIEFNKLAGVLDDIYQILKKNGLLRISLPNYDSEILLTRLYKFKKELYQNKKNNNIEWPVQSNMLFPLKIKGNQVIYDKTQKTNGEKVNHLEIKNNYSFELPHQNKVIIDILGGMPNKGGHIWFPTYNKVKKLLDESKFRYQFLIYHDENNKGIQKNVDLTKGYISRINDPREKNNQKINIVVDCYK